MPPVIAFLLAVSLAAALQEDTTPTFQAGTRLVEVDIVAKSKGLPAAGLTKEDFTILDNGKRQNIAFFSVRSVKSARTAEAPLPPGTYSNRLAHYPESAGRTTVILIDQMNTPQALQAYAIPRVVKFVASRRGADRIAIYTIAPSGALHVAQELTDNTDLLRRAAHGLMARDPSRRINDTTGMSAHEAEAYAAMNIFGPVQAVEAALKQIGRHLSGVPGRKNLVWVTTAFPLFLPDLGLDFRPDMEKAAHALNDAGIALYSVDARGLMVGLDGFSRADRPGPPASPHAIAIMMGRGSSVDTRGLDTEQMLSSLTGGLTFFNKSNAIEESIETAVEDGDVTYALGFYPDLSAQGEKWHNLKVGVARHGVELRYRTGYFAQREGDTANDPPALDQLLKEPLDSAQLELRAEAHPDPTRPGVLDLKVNIDLHGVSFSHGNSRRSGAVDLSFYVEGTHRLFRKPLKIEIPDDQFDAVIAKGLDAVAPIDITDGVEALRVVVQDKTTGAAGSLTVPLPPR